jgi:hypothetical protein
MAEHKGEQTRRNRSRQDARDPTRAPRAPQKGPPRPRRVIRFCARGRAACSAHARVSARRGFRAAGRPFGGRGGRAFGGRGGRAAAQGRAEGARGWRGGRAGAARLLTQVRTRSCARPAVANSRSGLSLPLVP